VILDDGNIFIGVNANNQKQIIIEDFRNNNSSELIAQLEYDVCSLLINEAQNILWAGDKSDNIFQYVLGPANGWKIQAKYLDLGIGEIRCLSRFGNLLFAGADNNKLSVINTADKKVFPTKILTSIYSIYSLHVCNVSPTKTYLTVTGHLPSYSDNKTDLLDISKFKETSIAKKIFSRPEFHINSIDQQFSNNSKIKELSINNKISKSNTPAHKNS
jgi:hypothetical protein